MIAPDETTFSYLRNRPFAPHADVWNEAESYWQTLPSDENARFDRVVQIDAGTMTPFVTWGTSPGMVVPVTGVVPDPSDARDDSEHRAIQRALDYMALKPRTKMMEVAVDRVFIGSCTNSRLEDLRAAARIVKGYKLNPSVRAMVVPGSQSVKRAAEAESLDQIFLDAGFEWRESGCSMCLGMNPDILQPGERCASTSNRNFEGRQGRCGR